MEPQGRRFEINKQNTALYREPKSTDGGQLASARESRDYSRVITEFFLGCIGVADLGTSPPGEPSGNYRGSYPNPNVAEHRLNYWTYATPRGVFSIVERSSRGVDLFFEQQQIGHYRSPVEAAEQVGNGKHAALPCDPENGKTLGVPRAVHEWAFTRKSRHFGKP